MVDLLGCGFGVDRLTGGFVSGLDDFDPGKGISGYAPGGIGPYGFW